MDYFDRGRWNPRFFSTPAEMESELDAFGIREKEIVGIHIIGMAQNMAYDEHPRIMRRTLAQVGVPYEDIDSGKYPVDTALVPFEVEICEPVVILFSDGTTLELMPKHGEGLLMSVNQIPPFVLDGTNNHNMDADAFFSCLQGRRIEKIRIIRQKTTDISRLSSLQESREITSFQFFLRSDSVFDSLGFLLQQGWEGWFKFCITNQNIWHGLENEIATTPYSAVRNAANDLHQILIVEGHDSSSYFWIEPVKPSGEEQSGMDTLYPEQISIEEDDISRFLYYFLDKYFDDTIPYEQLTGEHRKPRFEWNLEYNLYTYETMDRMLQDIETCSVMLERQYDDPSLDELKENFEWFDFVFDDDKRNRKPSEAEADDIIRDNIGILTDFYRRFVRRIRIMMQRAPEYKWISFMGP